VIVNAIDATAPGGVVRVGAASVAREGVAGVELTVEDHGAGIAIEVLPRIFDPFDLSRSFDRARRFEAPLEISILGVLRGSSVTSVFSRKRVHW